VAVVDCVGEMGEGNSDADAIDGDFFFGVVNVSLAPDGVVVVVVVVEAPADGVRGEGDGVSKIGGGCCGCCCC
jgi:hypothetical protein